MNRLTLTFYILLKSQLNFHVEAYILTLSYTIYKDYSMIVLMKKSIFELPAS